MEHKYIGLQVDVKLKVLSYWNLNLDLKLTDSQFFDLKYYHIGI